MPDRSKTDPRSILPRSSEEDAPRCEACGGDAIHCALSGCPCDEGSCPPGCRAPDFSMWTRRVPAPTTGERCPECEAMDERCGDGDGSYRCAKHRTTGRSTTGGGR